jgi:hypothetical protein
MSFHLERFEEFAAGDVIRVLPEVDTAFGDAIILGFNTNGDAKLSRPYGYAHNVGTTAPVSLLGSEIYSLPLRTIRVLQRVESGGRRA